MSRCLFSPSSSHTGKQNKLNTTTSCWDSCLLVSRLKVLTSPKWSLNFPLLPISTTFPWVLKDHPGTQPKSRVKESLMLRFRFSTPSWNQRPSPMQTISDLLHVAYSSSVAWDPAGMPLLLTLSKLWRSPFKYTWTHYHNGSCFTLQWLIFQRVSKVIANTVKASKIKG